MQAVQTGMAGTFAGMAEETASYPLDLVKVYKINKQIKIYNFNQNILAVIYLFLYLDKNASPFRECECYSRFETNC